MYCNRRGHMIVLFQNVLFVQLSIFFFHPFYADPEAQACVRHKRSGLFPAAQQLLDCRWAGKLYKRVLNQTEPRVNAHTPPEKGKIIKATLGHSQSKISRVLQQQLAEVCLLGNQSCSEKEQRNPLWIFCPLARCPHKPWVLHWTFQSWGADRNLRGTGFSKQNGHRVRA